jgi:broad specificity phosphatase PhoE
MKILLIRHGESIANVDRQIYFEQFDPFIKMSDKGIVQSIECGYKIIDNLDLLRNKKYIFSKNNEIKLIYSPYLRTLQTKDNIIKVLTNNKINIKSQEENSLLREQEYKFFQDVKDVEETFKERDSLFKEQWYRFKNAESVADVYQRSTVFINDLKTRIMTGEFKSYENGYIIIVSHQITLACLRLVLERKSIYDMDKNIDNCQCYLYNFNIKSEKHKNIKNF